MNINSRITVVTPVHNGSAYLRPLIESVLKQDYENFEHIIIDDGSTDNGATEAILKEYPHLRWWRHPNKGQYATQNDGLLAAKGDIISVISADDFYISPYVFRQVVQIWNGHPHCDALFGRTYYLDEDGKYMHEKGKLLPDIDVTGNFPKQLIRSHLYIQHCSLFVSGDLIRKNNILFDPRLKYTGDWDWIIRLFAASRKVYYVSQPLAVIRIHPQQTTVRSSVDAIFQEHRQILTKYHGSQWIYYALRKVKQYRAMLLIGWVTLRQKGLKLFLVQLQNWLMRRFVHRRRRNVKM